MFSISDVNGVNVYESWYQGDSATIAPMFDKFCSYSTAKPRFLSEFGAGSDERIHSYTPRTFDFTPEFQKLDLIADISMKWRNVRII